MDLAYEEHKIDEAFRFAQLLKRQQEESKKILSLKEEQMIVKIEKEMEDVRFFEEKMNQSGWQVRTQKKNITVSTKYEG